MITMRNKKNYPSVVIKYPLLSRALIFKILIYSSEGPKITEADLSLAARTNDIYIHERLAILRPYDSISVILDIRRVILNGYMQRSPVLMYTLLFLVLGQIPDR